jgi:putative exosortase-associated protein (TIGR04073 family)
MLKQVFLSICLASILVLAWAPAGAEEPVSEPGLPEQVGTKFLRGVGNLAMGWMEIPKQIYLVGTNEGWVAGALRGPFDGLGMFVVRTVAGAYEILTFPIPIPPHYQPLVQPEFVLEVEFPPAASGRESPPPPPPPTP